MSTKSKNITVVADKRAGSPRGERPYSPSLSHSSGSGGSGSVGSDGTNNHGDARKGTIMCSPNATTSAYILPLLGVSGNGVSSFRSPTIQANNSINVNSDAGSGSSTFSISNIITNNLPLSATCDSSSNFYNSSSLQSRNGTTDNRYYERGPDDDLVVNRKANNSDVNNNSWLDMIVGSHLISPKKGLVSELTPTHTLEKEKLGPEKPVYSYTDGAYNSTLNKGYYIEGLQGGKSAAIKQVGSMETKSPTVSMSISNDVNTFFSNSPQQQQQQRSSSRISQSKDKSPPSRVARNSLDKIEEKTDSNLTIINTIPDQSTNRSRVNSLEKIGIKSPLNRSVGNSLEKSPENLPFASLAPLNLNATSQEDANKLYSEAYRIAHNEDTRSLRGSLDKVLSPMEKLSNNHGSSIDAMLNQAEDDSSQSSSIKRSRSKKKKNVPLVTPGLLSRLDEKAKLTLASIDFSNVLSQRQNDYTSDGLMPWGGDKFDESSLLTRHIIDCVHTLGSILSAKSDQSNLMHSMKKSGDISNPKVKEASELLPTFMHKLLALDMTKVVTSTLTKPWDASDLPIYPDYFETSEYILNQFPELFAGAKSNSADFTLMHLATKYTSPHTAEKATSMLLRHSSNMINFVNDQNQMPLHTAMMNMGNTLESIKLLVNANPDALAFPDSSGFLPLHIAVSSYSESENERKRSAEIIKYLLDVYPAAAQYVCKKGRLPLHLACSYDNPDPITIKALISAYPSSINKLCDKGWLALHRIVAKKKFSVDSLSMLIWGIGGPKNLSLILPHNPDNKTNIDVMRTESDITAASITNIANPNGQLALHIYCESYAIIPEALVLLLRGNPNGVLRADQHEYLPIHIALDNQNPCLITVKMLLYGYAGSKSCSVPIKHPDNPSFFMYPLHLIVATSAEVSIEVCRVIAAMYPEAIKSGKSGLSKDANLSENSDALGLDESWSPYEKATQRSLKKLLVEFDKILRDDTYRNEIIKDYNHTMLSIFSTSGDLLRSTSNNNNSINLPSLN